MAKKNYISRGEHNLWQYLENKEIADEEDLDMIFPDMKKGRRNRIMHGLCRKGYLKRARRGLYYNPAKLKSFHELALRIRAGYIGLSSALRHHNLTEYEDFTIFVMTKSFRKKMEIEGTEYDIQYIPLGKLFAGYTKEGSIAVSSVEKTIFDCLLKPNIVGYAAITKAIYDAKIDWEKFLGFFRLAENRALCQRTGYILGMMKNTARLKVPAVVFGFLEKYAKSPIKLGIGGKKSAYNKRWKVQDNLGKGNILSWWR